MAKKKMPKSLPLAQQHSRCSEPIATASVCKGESACRGLGGIVCAGTNDKEGETTQRDGVVREGGVPRVGSRGYVET